MAKRGRPTLYSEALADRICALIMDSDYGLEQICQEHGLPKSTAIYGWLAKYPDFAEKYTRAKEAQAHVHAERGLRDALTAEDAQLGRLRWDARRWTASKLAPKVYGDKATQEHVGEGGGPIKTEVTVKFV